MQVSRHDVIDNVNDTYVESLMRRGVKHGLRRECLKHIYILRMSPTRELRSRIYATMAHSVPRPDLIYMSSMTKTKLYLYTVSCPGRECTISTYIV